MFALYGCKLYVTYFQYIVMGIMYGKTFKVEICQGFHGCLLHCKYFFGSMALLIGNMSIQACYYEDFPMNIPNHEKFSPQKFCHYTVLF